jgi:hypothetical protein
MRVSETRFSKAAVFQQLRYATFARTPLLFITDTLKIDSFNGDNTLITLPNNLKNK